MHQALCPIPAPFLPGAAGPGRLQEVTRGVKKPLSSHVVLQGTHGTCSDDSQGDGWLCYNPADVVLSPPAQTQRGFDPAPAALQRPWGAMGGNV